MSTKFLENSATIQIIQKHLPSVQAIYLFGTYGTKDQTPKSDVDIALLLPHTDAKAHDNLYGTTLHSELEGHFNLQVDLINLRMVNIVFQKEVIATDRRIFCGNANAADEYEMLTLSFYQKLNEERAEIIEDAIKTGRFYDL